MALNSITAALVAVVAYAWLQQRLPKPQSGELIRTGRQWLASSVPMALTDGMRTLQWELSILLMGTIAGAGVVGLFRVAAATATTAALATQVVSQVGSPVVARLFAQQDESRLQRAVTALARAQFAGVSLLSLPLLLGAEPLLTFAFGPSYELAANPLRILLLGQLLNAAFGQNTVLLNMAHQERRLTRAVLIATSLGIVFVPLLTHFAGAIGAATGMVVWILIWNVLTWLDARRILKIDSSIFGRSALR